MTVDVILNSCLGNVAVLDYLNHYRQPYILCNCFCIIVRFTTSGFYGQIIASRYMRRSLEKEFSVAVAAFVLA